MILKEIVVCVYDCLNEDFKLDLILLGGVDIVNLKENLEFISNKGEGELYVYVKEDYNDEVVFFSLKFMNFEEILYGFYC